MRPQSQLLACVRLRIISPVTAAFALALAQLAAPAAQAGDDDVGSIHIAQRWPAPHRRAQRPAPPI